MSVPVDPSAVLDSLSQGVYVVDRARRITYWNGAAAQLSGYESGEVLGSRCHEGLLNHVDDAGVELCGERCPLRMTMRDGRERSVHVYLHHKDGHLTPVHVSAAPLRDARGEIVGAVETFTDDSDFEATTNRAERLERLALLDPLTGVANRRFLDARLDALLHRQAVTGRGFGALMVDVDHFKDINDRHGHEAGDHALRAIARTLLAGVRADDAVTRFGGEEFVVVSDQDEVAQLLALGERLRALVGRARIGTSDATLHATVSVGATVALPTDTRQSLLARVDDALLRAKRAGRDRVLLG